MVILNEGIDGILKFLGTSQRWAVCRDGETPIEICSGDTFYIERPGEGLMDLTRMEFGHIKGRGQYYSIGGHVLRDGLRATYIGRGGLYG